MASHEASSPSISIGRNWLLMLKWENFSFRSECKQTQVALSRWSWACQPTRATQKRHQPDPRGTKDTSLPGQLQMSPNLDCALEQSEKGSWSMFLEFFNIHWMTHSYVSQSPGTFISKKGICLSIGELGLEPKVLVSRQEKQGRRWLSPAQANWF